MTDYYITYTLFNDTSPDNYKSGFSREAFIKKIQEEYKKKKTTICTISKVTDVYGEPDKDI